MAGGVAHQGIIAIVSEKPVLSLESLLDSAREPALVVVLDGVEDPRNLGAILRTAEAAGADGVMLPERHSAGLSETVSRASAGAIEHVRVARVGNLVQALQALKARGIWVVGFDAAGSERWDAVDLTQARGARARRRGPRHPAAGARALRPPGLDPAVRPHRLAQRLGGGRRRPLRGGAPASLRAERRAADPGAPACLATDRRSRSGRRRDGSRRSSGAARRRRRSCDADVAAASVRHVDLSDDVAWGQGPVVLKPVGFDRPHRVRRPASQGPPPRPLGQERRGPPPAAPAGPDDNAAARAARAARAREGQTRAGRRERVAAVAAVDVETGLPAPVRRPCRGSPRDRKALEAWIRNDPLGRTARRRAAAGAEKEGGAGGTSGRVGIGLARGGPVC